jgi:hypothetical protein
VLAACTVRRLASATLVSVSWFYCSAAQAKPEWNVGVETSACAMGRALSVGRLDWCNALHADVLFLRRRSADVGLGPSLRVGTFGFEDLRLDPGLSLLLPLWDELPVVLEAGPHLRGFSEVGAFGSAFFGLRTFNHYGHYSMAAGLVFTAEQSFTAEGTSAWWLGARIDGSWLALPFILAYQALR